ncbi:Rix1 complex component [Parasitella parasitica]|nr:Rix1 complex component [Parasitella parasitica]
MIGISLPNQSISEDKSHEITTSRNLTLTDLVVQLKHYNAGVKKEALSGLTDICTTHPALLVSSLGLVVNGILKLFVDEDRDVRKATLNYLKSTFVNLDRVELQPFMSLLVIYTCSAMTHIFEDVRLDAIKLMDLWIQIAPDIIVSKFWNRVTGNYMSLLTVDSNSINSNSNTASSVAITTASVKAAVTKSHLHIHKNKLGLFISLSKFLEAGLSEHDRDNYWFLLNYLYNKRARDAFKIRMSQYQTVDMSKVAVWDSKHKNQFTPAHAMVTSVAPYLSKGAALATYSQLQLFESSGPKNHSGGNGGGTFAAANGQTATFDINNNEFSAEERLGNIKQLIETFQPILLASWLEAAPSVFISTSTICMTPALELLYEILKLSLVLWRAMVVSETISTLPRDWLNAQLHSLLKHFTVYFPYGADSFGNRGSKVDDTLQEMNIMLCELTSLYLLARTMQSHNASQVKESERQSKKRRKLATEEEKIDQLPEWAETVVGHVLGVLGLDAAGNSVSTNSSFKAENLVSLLPAIWGFLNCLNYEDSIIMFKAALGYYHVCQPNSTSKRVMLDFITRVYMVQSAPSYNGQFTISKHSELANLLKEWFLSLPKVLWQLRTNHVETSRTILNIMCDVAKRSDKDVFDMSTLLEAETKLVPFFFVNLVKGPLFGPFNELPADVQQRALDYVQYLDSKSEKMANAIQQCRETQGSIGLYK